MDRRDNGSPEHESQFGSWCWATDDLREKSRCFELVTVSVFTIEYVVRLLVADRKIAFATSFLGMIDLLAILPFYLSFGVDLRSVRAFRLLRRHLPSHGWRTHFHFRHSADRSRCGLRPGRASRINIVKGTRDGDRPSLLSLIATGGLHDPEIQH